MGLEKNTTITEQDNAERTRQVQETQAREELHKQQGQELDAKRDISALPENPLSNSSDVNQPEKGDRDKLDDKSTIEDAGGDGPGKPSETSTEQYALDKNTKIGYDEGEVSLRNNENKENIANFDPNANNEPSDLKNTEGIQQENKSFENHQLETPEKSWKEVLGSFESFTWDNLKDTERKCALEDLRDKVAEDLNIEDKPEIKYYSNPDNTDFGGYSSSENTIYLNEYNLHDGKEAADTIAHESRHCWQHERAENPQTERDYAFKENFEDYVSPSDDYQEYKNQAVEVDAREYAENICNNIDNALKHNKIDKVAPETKEGHTNGSQGEPIEKGAVFDNRPDDIVSKIELKPISQEALNKCKEAGLSAEKVEEIRSIPQGEKPSPDTYLDASYIDKHLAKFEETGCYKIIGDKRGEPSGTIGIDSIFVMNGEDANKIINEADGNISKLEKALALKEGYLGDDPYIIKCNAPHNLRMADGNEENAWQNEWCPCGVTRGGVDEAVIDPIEKGEYSYKHVFGDDKWKE